MNCDKVLHRLAVFTWYCLAGALGSLLIACGCVRRARKRAFEGNVISAIYFHKPKRHLLLQCLQWLRKNGYTFISGDDLIEMLRGGKPIPQGAVWLSFDDGWREWTTDVLPVLQERKIPATLFIPSGVIEGDGKFPWLHDPEHPSFSSRQAQRAALAHKGERESITLAELQDVARHPEVTIGSHTVSHPIMPYCTDERIRTEIVECKRKLESWTGKLVRMFAYPEGRYDGREVRVLKESGHEIAVTTRSDFITREVNRYFVPRFSVGDHTSLPQAICSMVGVWRPVIDSVKGLSAVLTGRARHGDMGAVAASQGDRFSGIFKS